MNSYAHKLLEKKNQLQQKIADLRKDFLVSDDIQEHRLSICNDCEHLFKLTGQCKLCGCFTKAKTHIAQSSCPIKKWLPIVVVKT